MKPLIKSSRCSCNLQWICRNTPKDVLQYSKEFSRRLHQICRYIPVDMQLYSSRVAGGFRILAGMVVTPNYMQTNPKKTSGKTKQVSWYTLMDFPIFSKTCARILQEICKWTPLHKQIYSSGHADVHPQTGRPNSSKTQQMCKYTPMHVQVYSNRCAGVLQEICRYSLLECRCNPVDMQVYSHRLADRLPQACRCSPVDMQVIFTRYSIVF